MYQILFATLLLLGICVPVQGLFSGTSLQEYVESFVDGAKLELEGRLSLNDSAIGYIWTYFKSKYGRVYSSFGSFKYI
jgi:hypothetical protein